MASKTYTAVIFGGTGAVGRHLLRALLGSPSYTKVLEAGRRVTPVDSLPAGAKSKLEQLEVDFEKLEAEKLQGYDHVYITLGTTRKQAGSAEAFERIDREYVLNAAKATKSAGSTAQRLLYCSSTGSDPNSYLLYPRSKGLTEKELAELGYSDLLIFRPAMLDRPDPGVAEQIASRIFRASTFISNKAVIKVEEVALAMRAASLLGSAAIPAAVRAKKESHRGPEFTVFNNTGCLVLAKTDSA